MTTPLAKKLRMKTGMQGLIIAAPPGYLKLLAPLPDGFHVSSTPSGTYTFIQVFVKRLSELGKLSRQLSRHAAPNALAWISYPKKDSTIASDLSRDVIREKMHGFGWNTVALVAIDETWAALRFRPNDEAGSRSRRP
jgi:hypothetical protein